MRSCKSVGCAHPDKLDRLKELSFEEGRNFTHMLVFLFEVEKQIPIKVCNSFFDSKFNFLSQDRFGFSAFHYAVAFVASL